MQIQLDMLKKETGVLSGALPARRALEPPPSAPQLKLKILAKNGIGQQKEPVEEKEKQFEYLLEETDRSIKASALSPEMARVICWIIPSVYQRKANRLQYKSRSSI